MGRGDNAYVEGDLPAIDPIGDINVCWARLGIGNEAWHFFRWVKRRMLRLLINIVPNLVMASALQPIVVVAVQCMIAVDVVLLDAICSLTFSGFQERETEAITHGHT